MDQRRQTIAAYLLVTVTTTSDAFPHPDLWSSRTQPQKPAHAAQEKAATDFPIGSRIRLASSQRIQPRAQRLRNGHCQWTAGSGRACHPRGLSEPDGREEGVRDIFFMGFVNLCGSREEQSGIRGGTHDGTCVQRRRLRGSVMCRRRSGHRAAVHGRGSRRGAGRQRRDSGGDGHADERGNQRGPRNGDERRRPVQFSGGGARHVHAEYEVDGLQDIRKQGAGRRHPAVHHARRDAADRRDRGVGAGDRPVAAD